ncbi:hypothetical protein K8O96_09085 [Clostridium sporogenes]|uniref:hypothetical protein n=1 Tax=Clostridium caseinilyticum TaxID=3350403 RepID=UPI0013D67C95|nr:hypothetical protein [Clostridium sporogenes]UAL58345.1 hypothetical protein K8O96_09085 [Clostridium sporogenes]
MKNYEELTGFIEVSNLESISDDFGGTGTPCAATATIGLTIKVATAVVCETGACTGYCK